MNAFTFTGPSAELRWGYHTAAQVKDWSIEQAPGGLTVTGQIISSDTFRISQRPMVFTVPRLPQAWRWPILSLQIAGGALHATLGPAED